jgi:hypothetical protein
MVRFHAIQQFIEFTIPIPGVTKSGEKSHARTFNLVTSKTRSTVAFPVHPQRCFAPSGKATGLAAIVRQVVDTAFHPEFLSYPLSAMDDAYPMRPEGTRFR